MSRPCYALWILLLAFAGSMLAVEAVQGQTTLDARLGNIRHRVCPLLGDQILSCGYGPLATPLGLAEVQRGCALSETLGPVMRGAFGCNLGTITSTKAAAATAPDREQLLSGHDPLYDAIVYGEQAAAEPASPVAAPAAAPLGFVFFLADPAPAPAARAAAAVPRAEICMQDFCGQPWFDACWPVPAAPAPAPLASVVRPTLDAEPDSLADYYAMYGGAVGELAAEDHADRSAALAALLALPARLAKAAWDSPLVAAPRCELNDWSYRLRHRGREFAWNLQLRSGYHRWIAAGRPAVSDLARPAAEPAAPQLHAAADQLGRALLRSLANSLDRTGRALQNASLELNNLLENETSEVSTLPDLID